MSIEWFIDEFGRVLGAETTTRWPCHIKIPSVIDGIIVKEIGKFLFTNNAVIESVEIPYSAIKIAVGAFEECRNLKTVVFEGDSQLEEIQAGAFSNCHLEAFPFDKLPKLKRLGERAFFENEYLTKADLSNTDIDDIDDECFSKAGLVEVQFPKKLKRLGQRSFAFTKLKEIDFSDITDVTQINICSAAFKANVYLSKITFPEVDTYLSPEVFESCNSLENLIIPANVSLGDFSFCRCENLKTVVFKEGTPTYNYLPIGVFGYCYMLKDVKINTEYTTIGQDAFHECGCLKTITFPETLQKIQLRAFYHCTNIEEIDLTERDIQTIECGSFSFTDFGINDFKMDFTSGAEFDEDAFLGNENISSKAILDKYPFCNIRH